MMVDPLNRPGFTKGLVHRVLVVDEPAELSQIRGILEANDCDVDVCEEGGQASAVFKVNRPDFVIVELLLPGETGFEICERMKRIDDTVPILALTALDLDSSRNLAVRVGIDAYLTKPCAAPELLDMIREVAEAVWRRHHGEQLPEKGKIRFVCRCGQKIAVHIRDRGKTMHCPGCRDTLAVPFWVGSRYARFFMPREESPPVPSDSPTADPLNYVTIRCTDCGTYYRLFTQAKWVRPKCPRCQNRPSGPLSLGDSPLSRAALVGSRRLLIIQSGKQKGKKFLLPQRDVIVGSDKTCDIHWVSDDIAPRHCSIRLALTGPIVTDLGTESGTLVNGRIIQRETPLAPGDLLEVAGLKLQLAARNLKGYGDSLTDFAFLDEEDAEQEYVRADLTQEAFETTADEAAKVALQFWDTIRPEE